MTTLHVLPVDDLIDHADSDDCICGPTIEPIAHDDGTIDWLVTHHSLDGRENHENHENDEAEEPRSGWWARWRPTIELVFGIAFGFIWGATTQPSYEVTRWIILAVSTAYLAAMVASYTHTRRNR